MKSNEIEERNALLEQNRIMREALEKIAERPFDGSCICTLAFVRDPAPCVHRIAQAALAKARLAAYAHKWRAFAATMGSILDGFRDDILRAFAAADRITASLPKRKKPSKGKPFQH